MPPYFDPLGETESQNMLYTIAVYIPKRPSTRWLSEYFSGTPVIDSSSHVLPSTDDSNEPKNDGFLLRDLDHMSSKTIKVESAWFPSAMRCSHVRGKARSCEQGCYVLEKGGGAGSRFFCKREDCEGHEYSGRVKMDGEGRECFGKPGKRMVCLD